MYIRVIEYSTDNRYQLPIWLYALYVLQSTGAITTLQIDIIDRFVVQDQQPAGMRDNISSIILAIQLTHVNDVCIRVFIKNI